MYLWLHEDTSQQGFYYSEMTFVDVGHMKRGSEKCNYYQCNYVMLKKSVVVVI